MISLTTPCQPIHPDYVNAADCQLPIADYRYRQSLIANAIDAAEDLVERYLMWVNGFILITQQTAIRVR
jgi:hypothetical protein